MRPPASVAPQRNSLLYLLRKGPSAWSKSGGEFSPYSRIVIVGQAPGLKVHKTGIAWHDASGNRLRDWLGVSRETFYDPSIFGIVPMGFCYPGKGKSGDRPPRPECAKLWMQKILKAMRQIELIILIGQYSQNYFLAKTNTMVREKKKLLTERVKNFENYLPKYFVLPHQSARNNIWLKKNPWFHQQNVPVL